MTTLAKPVQQSQGVEALELDVMALIFDQFKTIFPAWHTTWPSERHQQIARVEWFNAFKENGIHTREQLRRGMAKARANDSAFMPSPGTFIAWCKVTALDLCLPSADEAVRMAIRHDPLAPAIVKLAARACKWVAGNAKAEVWEKEFKRVYNDLVARAAGGADLDAEWQELNRPALPAPEPMKASQEVAEFYLANMRNMLRK